MIVDAHAHVGARGMQTPAFLEEMAQPFLRASGAPVPGSVYEGIDPDAMMAEYRAAGVDKVFIFAVAPREERVFGRDPRARVLAAPHVPNEYVAEVHARFPDLTVPVMAVNPVRAGAAVEREVERAVVELGGRAIKLYPTYNHYRPDDRELCWPVYRKALELGVPVIVHQSWTTTVDAPMKFQRPAQLDDVAREFRELPLVLAHMGTPWVDEAMCLVAKHDNVYVDLSFWSVVELPEVVLQHLWRCQRYGCTWERILFGTDYPLTTPAENLRIFREELPRVARRTGLPAIPDEALALVLGGNAERLYELAPRPTTSTPR